jgi:signal recognition particle subunit SEC65
MRRYNSLIESITLIKINKALLPLGYELIKGKGYFYFWPLDFKNPNTPQLKDESLLYYSIKQIPSIESIIQNLKNKINETI